jgi:TonB family protein
MREAVSDVLSARNQVADGLTRMVMVSLGAHLVLVALVALVPGEWLGSSAERDVPRMMISLGGAPGPDTGGMTQMAARPVQQVAPEQPKERFVQAPAANTPKMTVPEPAAKPRTRPTRVEKPAERSTTRKPSTGAEIQSGASRVDTGGVAVPFGGLSQGGGGGQGLTPLNVENFCCPEYLRTMLDLIRRNWNPKQGAFGEVVVKYTVRRDGMLTQIEVSRPSNNPVLDLESRRAVINTRQLPPLPAQYTEPHLTIHLTFEYKR